MPPVPVLAPIATPSSSSSAAVSAASASSASASAASAAASRPTAAQRCAFADALFNYTHSRYRFDTPDIVRLAALLLYLWRGNYRPSADSVPVLRSFIPDLCPPYAILDSAADHPRSYGMGKASSAVSATDMAVSIQSEYAGLHPAFSPADAAAQFVHICRQSPLYGHEFFTAKRTWKEAEEAGDGSVREVQHTEDVMMAVGHEGFLLLGMEDPLAVTTYDYGELIRWTTSRDGKIFAFSLEDRIVYIVTDDAPYIVRTTDRYVEERVRHMQAAEGGAGDAPPAEVDSSATPRSDKTPGLGPVPTVTGTLEAPRPRFSRPDLPAPPCVVHIGTASRSSHSGFSPSVSSRSLLARSVVSDGMHSGASSVLEGGAGASVCTTPAVTITEVMAAQLLGNPASPGGDAGGGGGAGAGGGAGELPEGWVQLTDSDGDVYYYCEVSNFIATHTAPLACHLLMLFAFRFLACCRLRDRPAGSRHRVCCPLIHLTRCRPAGLQRWTRPAASCTSTTKTRARAAGSVPAASSSTACPTAGRWTGMRRGTSTTSTSPQARPAGTGLTRMVSCASRRMPELPKSPPALPSSSVQCVSSLCVGRCASTCCFS